MVGKNNLDFKLEKNSKKIERYSIKKIKIGAVSVVVGVGIYFGGGVAYAADSQVLNEENPSSQNEELSLNNNEKIHEDEEVSSEQKEKVEASKKDESTAGLSKLRSVSNPGESEGNTEKLEKKDSVVKMSIDKLTQGELYAGEWANAKFKFEVEHGASPLTEVTLKYDIIPESEISYSEMKISDFNNNEAIRRGIGYTQKIGTITPGTKLEIPFSYHISERQRGMDDKKYTLRITAVDLDEKVLGVVEEKIVNKMQKLVVPEITYQGSAAGGSLEEGVVAGYKKDGKVSGRSIVNYRLSYPEELIQIQKEKMHYGRAEDYLVRMKFDENNFRYYIDYNSWDRLDVERMADGYWYIARGVMKNGPVSFIYTGDSLDVPDTNIQFELVHLTDKGNFVVESSKKTGISHKNILKDSDGRVGNISVENVLNIETSSEYKDKGGYAGGVSITHPSDKIFKHNLSAYSDGDTIRAHQYIKIKGNNSNVVEELKTIDIDFTQLTNGKDNFETLTKFTYRYGAIGGLEKEDKVYLVKNDGSKVELPNLFEGSLRDLSAPVDIRDSKGIRIERNKSQYLTENAAVSIEIGVEDKTTKKDEVLSKYKFDAGITSLAPTDSNQYNYKVRINDEVQWYSPYEALIEKEDKVGVSLNFAGEAKYIGGETYFISGADKGSSGKVKDLTTIKPVMILPTGMEIVEAKNGDYENREIERIVPLDSGYTLYIFKPRDSDVYYREAVTHNAKFKVTEAGVRNATSDLFTFYGYSGAIIENGNVNTLSTYTSVGDVQNDEITKEILAKNIVKNPLLVLAKAKQSVNVPRGLSIYDQSSKTNVDYHYDSTGVEKGATVYIRPTIKNLSGVAYKDIKVVTVLSHEDDNSFDGKLKRSSEFTPVLKENSVVTPVGWKVYATDEEQSDSTNANELSGWVAIADVKDWSKVKALKWESNNDFVLDNGRAVDFGYAFDIPKNEKYGRKITTTSAIATGGSNNFLEGYRSTVRLIEKYEKVTINYEDEDGNVIKTPIVEEKLVEGDYDTTKLRNEIIYDNGERYNYYKIKEGSNGEKGVIEEGKPINVTYIYTKDSFETEYIYATLRVKYVEEGTGEELYSEETMYDLGVEKYKVSRLNDKRVLIEDKTITPDYTTTAPQKYTYNEDGYVLAKTPENANGKILKGNLKNDVLEIVYEYKEDLEERVENKEVKRKIVYVDQERKQLDGVRSFEDKVVFKRKIKENALSKKVKEEGVWSAEGTNVLKGNKLPYVQGYIAINGIESSQKDKEVLVTDEDINEEVSYLKLGAWIVENPNVEEKDYPRITYPNHPTDPTKLGELPSGIIPYVPGYTPVANGEKLIPTKDSQGKIIGYNPPMIPENKGEDTLIKYEKDETPTTDVVTTYVDEKDNQIAPQEKGKKEAKVIAGYDYDRTEVDVKGNIKHIYKKVTTPMTDVVTTYVDEKDNQIAPQEKGKKEAKPIEGYKYDRTEVDEKGNIKHIYKKVTTPTTDVVTTYVDEKDNQIAPQEKGKKEAKVIAGYDYDRTEVDVKGNIKHIYKKVTIVRPKPRVEERPKMNLQVQSERPTEEEKRSGQMMDKKQLPKTSVNDVAGNNANAAGVGVLGVLIALAVKRRRKDK